jgi:NTE family protein
MSDDPIFGLVCAGGGAHGAYQVGVLKYVHEHFCNGGASPFQVFAGTSCGSLNTSFFAARSFDARASRLRLERMWLDFHVPAYHGNVVRNSIAALLKEWVKPRRQRRPTWSLLDPTHLHDVVARGFERASLERSFDDGTTIGVAVSTTEVRSSRLVFFQEGPAATSWTVPGSVGIETRLGVPHIQASCSVPIAFPPVRIGDHDYADGGVANKRPFIPAVNMGATRILSIATDQPMPDRLPDYPAGFKPGFGDTLKMLLEQLGHDYAKEHATTIAAFNYFREQAPEEAHGAFGHILFGREIQLEAYRPVVILQFAPSRRIRPTDIFNPALFDEALDPASSTALLFHRDFVRPLIELGYDDALARHDELAEFFGRA